MKRDAFNLIMVVQFLALALTGSVSAEPLRARPVPAKPATVVRPQFESELSVKFRDDLKVRAENGNVAATAGGNLAAVQQVQQQYGLSFQQSIQLPQQTLDFIETRAAQMSGIAQPDFAGSMIVTGLAATLEQAANALLGLAEVEWVEFVMHEPPLPQVCSDIIPQLTPDFFGDGLQNYHGLNPGLNMTCAWACAGRGQNVRIADCEWAYIQQHEDRCLVQGPPLSCDNRHMGETHGSAVLSELGALDNGYGCTGLTPQAELWFFSEIDQNTCLWSASMRDTAIATAIAYLRPGDVFLLESETSSSVGLSPTEVIHSVWDLTWSATQSGIIVVAAAGNGGEYADLDAAVEGRNDDLIAWRNWGDSGAIIVGAGTADALHERLDFSTYGSRVNLQGWGESVFTLGWTGNFFDGGPGRKQTYTNEFNGTSAASPFVVAAAASLQSIRYAQNPPLLPLTPLQMRQLLIDTGRPQGGTLDKHIGPFPDMAKAILHLGIGATDCNANNIPDLCEGGGGCCVGGSCNVMTPTCCSAQGGTFLGAGKTCTSPDCNNNGVADGCDISRGTSEDCNVNGVPDECDDTGACCLSDSPNDCVMTPTSACCDALNGIWWYGTQSECETTDCSECPLRPQQGP